MIIKCNFFHLIFINGSVCNLLSIIIIIHFYKITEKNFFEMYIKVVRLHLTEYFSILFYHLKFTILMRALYTKLLAHRYLNRTLTIV